MKENALDTALDAFLDHLVTERGLASNTIGAYGRDLRGYVDTLEGLGITRTERIEDEAVEYHLARLSRGGLKASSRARTISAIRQFHRFLKTEGLLRAGVAADITSPKRASRIPKVLTISQIEKLLDQPDETHPLVHESASPPRPLVGRFLLSRKRLMVQSYPFRPARARKHSPPNPQGWSPY